jgi:hypothetical protein
LTENPFARPQATAGDKWDLKNEGHRWLGSLFLIIPKELTPNWKSPNNNYEPTDKVTADVIAVTGPDAGKAWLDTFILSKGIVYILRDKIGDPVPGVLGRKTTQNGEGWTLIDAQTDQEWDAMCAQVAPVYQRYQQGQFKRAAAPAAAAQNPGPSAGANYQAAMAQDPWAGMNAAPATPQAGWNAAAPPGPAIPANPAPPAASPAAAPAGQQDPNVGLLISKGLDPQQVLAMDPATRAAIAATY